MRTIFFEHAPFNAAATDPDNYLIIGRRGSGKTSLANYFSFQKDIANCACIDVNEPEVYHDALARASASASASRDLTTAKLVSIWEHTIWSLVFDRLKTQHPDIKKAAYISPRSQTSAKLVQTIWKAAVRKLLGKENPTIDSDIEDLCESAVFLAARNAALTILAANPYIVAVDSLERYNIDDEPVINATAALIECASNMNREYSERGLHIKVFLSAEIYPYLSETAVRNTAKYIRHPVYLHWRPKDLVRLAGWRLYKSIEASKRRMPALFDGLNWDSFDSVHDTLWRDYFGERLMDGLNRTERTFPYILRHTQMRPRQMVILCNAIARLSAEYNCLPAEKPEIVVEAVSETEKPLAREVINSYAMIYPHVDDIVLALVNSPIRFPGKWLDKIAPRTASHWPSNTYSPDLFRKLVAELGIVGRVDSYDERTNIVQATFEYSMDDRLKITEDMDCVIHPMFFGKFQLKHDGKTIVYPFPRNKDYVEVEKHSEH